MSLHRFFAAAQLPSGDGPIALPLSDSDLHHAARVLRLRVGDEIAVVAPDRTVHRVAVAAVSADELSGEVIGQLPVPVEPAITLVQGLAKGAKMDLVVEKAVEIGVEQVWPIAFVRSVVRIDQNKAAEKGERWRRIAESAAKQSGRSFVPRVADPEDARGLLGRLDGFDRILVAWEEAGDASGIAQALKDVDRDARVAIVIGPEGGLVAEEVAALRSVGARTVSMGRTILRTETAGIVASALCVQAMGGLGGRPSD